MGNLFSDPESRIIIVGLDNSGKSTLIKRMKPDEFDSEAVATVGNFRHFQSSQMIFQNKTKLMYF